MGHWTDARIAIEKRLQDAWGTTTPIRFWSSGVPFVAPTNAPFIAVKIEDFDGRQVTLGSGVQNHRYQGQVTVQIFTPHGDGPNVADSYAETVDALFRRASFSYGVSGTIVCRTPVRTSLGVQDGWYQVNVRIPFQRDAQH